MNHLQLIYSIMSQTEIMDKLAAARTPTEVLRLIHIDLPTLPTQAHTHLFPMAYGKLEAVMSSGEEGCTGGRGVPRLEELL